MNTPTKLKIIGVCLVFGVIFLIRALRRHKKLRQVTDTPRSKTRTAAQGFVELEGFAWPDSTTVLSSSGHEAIYHCFQLQKEVSRGSGRQRRRTWETVFERRHVQPFYLIDAQGLIWLDPNGADLNLEATSIRSWRSLNSSEQERILRSIVNAPLASFPPSMAFFGLFSPKYRIVENEIRVGSPMYVTGDFKAIEGEIPDVRDPGLLYFAGRSFDLKTGAIKNISKILDTDGDGSVDAEEAKQGYSFLAKIARQKAKDSAIATSTFEKPMHLHGTMGSSQTNRLFIADTHQIHLTKRLERFLWTQFIGGAALITIAIVLGWGWFREAPKNLTQRAPNSQPPTKPGAPPVKNF